MQRLTRLTRLPVMALPSPWALQRRSLWNLPAARNQRLLTTTLTVGGGILATMVLGPIVLVAAGGIASVMAWKMWRLRRQIQQQGLGPLFAEAFSPRMFSHTLHSDPAHIQEQALQKIRFWAETEAGQRWLRQQHMDAASLSALPVTSMSSYSEASSIGGRKSCAKYMTIEFNVVDAQSGRNASAAQVTAMISPEGVIQLQDIRLLGRGDEVTLPLNDPIRKGNVIEGEFRDIP
ncbi:uncharacterized protein BYT42DRAFT_548344 [Radiomyces spectabilis]|uniref:uncharacterized protein n=1 Tax=Radiomyces spectabilis TaxID=64574 RepID=UPI0022207DB0|nr:uncharacterized protein BYT42DRAFT_548344 [Radiomyces spectabilis]KAI8371486.1 hypothetical protein BYT42DRAFT_548344 [Radiomyces spectabilis]